MEATLELDLSNPEKVLDAVKPDLQDSDRLKFDVSIDDSIQLKLRSKSLGVLRGGINTAMKLVKLSKKLMS
ncbi:MAG: KEOPS complex subunit Pcc1 [Candidatus Nanohaloarchaea archaeon]|nr:KEOPS complex subunit Pcc1 [Candidatus Nanohaloarchaea archaeon]